MNSDFQIDLIREIESAWPLHRWDEFRVVVAVSGGADSVALLLALVEIKKQSLHATSGSLAVAHFNHQLRGADSDKDAEFVSQLAERLGLDCQVASAEDNVASKSKSKNESENDLREQRYQFLTSIARQTNSRYIATAHHRGDQIETVLFRILRGTGLGGLGGIPISRVVDESLTIVRPMLNVQKSSIEEALNSWNQTWREDASNSQSRYTRNFIRNEILPLLHDRFPNVDGSIARLSHQATEQSAFLESLAQGLFESVNDEDGIVVVDCQMLREQSPVLLRELLIRIFRQQSWPTSQLGFDELDRLAGLVVSQCDEPLFQLPGGINCQKIGGKMRLGKR